MIRYPDQTACFDPLDGVLPLAHTGFTSFQHTRNEPLFSDRLTGGWIKEFYPLDPRAHADGNGQGYHPDCRVAYYRFAWHDLEPQDGVYDFHVVEEALQRAAACGQTVMLRLMPHTTCGRQEVPAWLIRRIPDYPRRADEVDYAAGYDKRSPEDPLFARRYADLVVAFAKRYDGDPRLMGVDLVLCGAWGEGEGSHTYPTSLLKQMIDCYTHSMKHTPLLGQIQRPDLINYARQSHPQVGFRCDCLGDMDWHMPTLYPRLIGQIDPDAWKTGPISFECGWTLMKWKENHWDPAYIFEQALDWHISTFNAKHSSCPPEWKNTIERFIAKMGYRLAVRRVSWPATVCAGDVMVLTLDLENRGCAPLYNFIPLTVRLRGATEDFTLDTGLDARRLLPGRHCETVWLRLPVSMRPGDYRLQIGLTDADERTPLSVFATKAPADGRYCELGHLSVKSPAHIIQE